MAVNKRRNSVKERLIANFGNLTGQEPEEEVVDISDDEDELKAQAFRRQEQEQERALERMAENPSPVSEEGKREGEADGPSLSGEETSASAKMPETVQDEVPADTSFVSGMDEEASGTEQTEKGLSEKDFLADLGPNHRLTTILPERMVTYLRIRAASEGVFRAQISYVLMKLIRKDMEEHKDLTRF